MEDITSAIVHEVASWDFDTLMQELRLVQGEYNAAQERQHNKEKEAAQSKWIAYSYATASCATTYNKAMLAFREAPHDAGAVEFALMQATARSQTEEECDTILDIVCYLHDNDVYPMPYRKLLATIHFRRLTIRVLETNRWHRKIN